MMEDLNFAVPPGKWEVNAEGDICIMTHDGKKVCLHVLKPTPEYDTSKELVITIKAHIRETIELIAH
jgi:hypothetical protein